MLILNPLPTLYPPALTFSRHFVRQYTARHTAIDSMLLIVSHWHVDNYLIQMFETPKEVI